MFLKKFVYLTICAFLNVVQIVFSFHKTTNIGRIWVKNSIDDNSSIVRKVEFQQKGHISICLDRKRKTLL